MELINQNNDIHPNYELSIIKNIYKFFGESRFQDVDLVINEERYSSNKLILTSTSLYCNDKIKGDTKEIVIDYDGEINSTIMKNFFQLIYTGRLDICVEYIEETISLAHNLRVETALEFWFKHYKENLTIENIFKFYDLVKKYRDEADLIKAFKEFVSEKFSEIVKHESFLKVKLDVLCEILDMEELEIESEYEVFEAVKLWSSTHSHNQTEKICLLFKYVKYEFMSIIYIGEQVLPLLDKCLICNDIKESIISQMAVKKRNVNDIKLCQSSRDSPVLQLLVTYETSEIDSCNSPYLYYNWSGETYDYIKLNNANIINHSLLVNEILYFFNVNDTSKIWSVNIDDSKIETISIQQNLGYQFSEVEINGEIFFTGGCTNSHTVKKSVMKWNISRNEWNSVNSMLHCRKNHKSIAHSGKLYVFGGQDRYNSYLFTGEVYDPTTNEWEILNIPQCTHSFEIVAVDHYLYILGGKNNNGAISRNVFRFDTCNKTFTPLANLPISAKILCACVFQRKIICLCNVGVLEYDIYADTWEYTFSDDKIIVNCSKIFNVSKQGCGVLKKKYDSDSDADFD